MIALDEKDHMILKLLQENGKLNTKELAASIGLTVTPTYERVKRLEKTGVIKNYKAVVDRKATGKDLQVFCSVTLKLHAKKLLTGFEQAVVKLDEVVTCFHVAGNFDYLLQIAVSDMEDYQNFIKNKLASIDNIANVQSTFIMTTIKDKM